ncbi:hypothetical protein NM688_g5375 [Phlebia brevispora]|uniref:Uncharacterized protein n=1 Tax=Phlebia brevispora TaxID=194682 RepID=A0ACC1SWW0_9APHY|nr:hypothetical protein NM688_g5375 [Phlebia brevispora]
MYKCRARLAKKPAHASGLSGGIYSGGLKDPYNVLGKSRYGDHNCIQGRVRISKHHVWSNLHPSHISLVYNYSVVAALAQKRQLHSMDLIDCTLMRNLRLRCHNHPLQYFLRLLEVLPRVIIAVFSALRVFALLGRTYAVAAFTFALGVVPVVLTLNQISRVTYHYIHDTVLGSSCYPYYVISSSALFDGQNYPDHIMMVLIHLTATLAAVLSMIVADIIAIATTWIKMYRHVQEASSIGVKVGLSAALLRDGSLYFIVLFVINLAHAVILFIPSLIVANPVGIFTAILPNIILSRFLINIRQVNTPESGNATHFSRFSLPTLRMPSISIIIGNLGEPLARNEDDIDNEDHVIAEAHEDGTSAAVISDEEVGMPDVINIGIGEIEEVGWQSAQMSARGQQKDRGGPVKYRQDVRDKSSRDRKCISAELDLELLRLTYAGHRHVLENLPTIIVAVFSTLRVFALLSRTYIPAAFTLTLGLAPVAFVFYQTSQATSYYTDDPPGGPSCNFNYVISPSVVFYSKNYSDNTMMMLTHVTATLAGTISAIAADIIAITTTWIKTYRHIREAASVGANVGFSVVLLGYGGLYFIVLFIIYLATGLVTLDPSLQSGDPVEIFTAVLPNVILSRFLINLRQVDAPESGSAARLSHFSLPNFRVPSIPSIIGNLGEPLADHEDGIDDDEDHVIAEVYEDGTHVAVSAGEEVAMSDVMDSGIGLTEEVPRATV